MYIWHVAQEQGLDWTRHEREQGLLDLCCYVQAALMARYGPGYQTRTQWEVPDEVAQEAQGLIDTYFGPEWGTL